jgi:serine/threonine protein kinase
VEPDRWQQIAALCGEVLELPATDRAAILRERCSHDPTLQAEVESLLAIAAKPGPLDAAANQSRPDDEETRMMEPHQTVGQTIGPYRMLQLIGQGGMGEVWLADQRRPVRRRVAIKLIKAGMDTREVVARFESERQALALMDHPSIAKVFDGGSTPQGRPYFVMEYVTGIPITSYCDKHKLTINQRLELFVQVCEGVQHAHQRAIIHRDLKPSNILVGEVDGKLLPKIIDFGVAKATSQRLTANTMFTRVGAIVGTPGYMSPEQADSAGEDIDTRTDVYSLGVVLYELLVGALPLNFSKDPWDQIVRRLRDEDAPQPSAKVRTLGERSSVVAQDRGADLTTLARQLVGDVDAIVLKALEKDRSRRYSTPSELATDIGRYLRNEPVIACSASAAYRARKYIRRHRIGVAVTAASAVLLVSFSVTVGILAYVARSEKARSEKNLRLAQNAVDEMLSSAGRETARVAADVPQMEEFRGELLSKARNFYNIFITEKPNSETLRNETAGAHFMLGDIDRLLPEPRDAVDEYKEAIVEFQALLRDYPRKAEYRQALANSYNWLGETLRNNGGTGHDVAEAYEKALGLQEDLIRLSPGNIQYQRELARTHYNRGILNYSLGQIGNSDSDFQEAIRLLTPLAEKEPASPGAQELARVYNNRGNLFRHEDKLSEARDFYERAIRIHETLVNKEPNNREYKQELAMFKNNFTRLLLDQKQFNLAEQESRQAIDSIEGLAAPALSLRLELANAHAVRCQLLESEGSPDAESECRECLDALDKLSKVPALHDRPEVRNLFRDLGYNFAELAKRRLAAGAVAEGQRSLDSLRRLLPEIAEPDRQSLTKSYEDAGGTLRQSQPHR